LSEIIAIVLIVVEALVLLPLLYLVLLTVAGLFYRKKSLNGIEPRTRFAALVPAHNEEKLLPKLLKTIGGADYPKELVRVFVVADNCTDDTAASVADLENCEVFERVDDTLVGKGHALEWLLKRIESLSDEFDAYLFLDADCEISPNTLRVFDAHIQGGALAVQGYYTTANPTETWVSSLRYIALALLHHTRPSGRAVLGVSSGLFGTGMALHRSIIQKFGWQTHGLAEDVEYFMLLTENGVKVSFAREAEILSAMPATLRASRTQNERWEKGRLAVFKRYGLKFFWNGLRRRSRAMIDAAIEQAIPPLSVVGLAGVALLIASAFTGSWLAIGLAAAVLGSIAFHAIVGLVAARPPFAVFLSVAYVPWYAVWKASLYLRAMKPGHQKWVRTERSD
jgi:cellulose synthase/poly-beta-1,6-N-acetylglucosamine synthase-like glycosyltransferase